MHSTITVHVFKAPTYRTVSVKLLKTLQMCIRDSFWTPQTVKMGDGWQYTYTANKIRGFKQTHQPSPWINDYGQFSIMPVVGKPEFNEEKRARCV